MIGSAVASHPSPLIRQGGRLVFSGAPSVRVEMMGAAAGFGWWMLAGLAAFFLWRQ